MITSPITAEGGSTVVPPAGPQGLSAYDVAVQNGFVGTESSWLASLQGPGADPTSLNAAVSRATVAATNASGFAATAGAAATAAAAALVNIAGRISDATTATVSAIMATLQASVTAAAGSATAAGQSATAAAGSATAASGSVASATAQASAASTSASASAGSASAAAGSATAAAGSATTVASSAATAQNWAMQTSGTVDGTYASARAYALQAAASAASISSGPVTSVNGKTGVVTLAASDLGAATPAQVSARLATAGDQATGAVDLAPSVTVASALTTAIGAAASNFVQVTGSTAITAFDAVSESVYRFVRFTSAGLVLTHDATKLALPSAANITTQAGDHAIFRSLGAGNWRCISYQRMDGTALVSPTLSSLGAAAASDVNIAQQNLLYQGLLIAALRGVPTGIVDGILDPFSSTADINTSASSGYTFNSGAGTIGATPPSTTTVSQAAYAISGGSDVNYPANNLFGNSVSQWDSSQQGTGVSGVAHVGQDFGAGNSQAINQIIVTANPNTANIASVIPRYAESPSGPWTNLPAVALNTPAGSVTTISLGNNGNHRCWDLLANANPSSGGAWFLGRLQFQVVSGISAMTLQSATLSSAVASPSAMRALIQVDSTSAAFTPNTDMVVSLTRDGGTTFTQGTLSLVQSMPDGTVIYDTGWLSVTGQPTGNSTMTYKVTTPTQKAIVLTGVSMQVKP